MARTARDTCLRLLERAGVPIDGDEPWSIRVHDERLWERALAGRNLGLGEAYVDGWWDCHALDELFVRLITADVDGAIRPSPGLAAAALAARVTNRQSERRAARNARHHYDIGNDLFARMLDARMVYSCGYWTDARDLDAAQEAKLDLVCRKLALEPGMRLLDVGCGWGGLARFAAERHGVSVVGISPAANQVALARERCAGLPVEIVQTDYRRVGGTFDRIVSVGMLEHVGPRNLRRFFAACDERLAPGGMMLHHHIGSRASKTSVDPWFDRYVFPGGVLPSVAQMGAAAEPGWVVEDVHNFGPDYDRTLMAWHANVDAAWDELPAYDERFRRLWRYYLLSCAAGFRVRDLQLWQWVFRRPGPAGRYTAVR